MKSALAINKTCLAQPALFSTDFPLWLGQVDVPETSAILPDHLKVYNSRNNRLALAAVSAPGDDFVESVRCVTDYYGKERVGIVIGTSTSGVYESELAYTAIESGNSLPSHYNYQYQHAWASSSQFLENLLGTAGPAYTISTACSSSAKAIASAHRLIATGVCDAVIAGGVDSLCRTTVYGFSSLGLVSEFPCTPLDENRSGISPGEGAAFLLLEKPGRKSASRISLFGSGETSDAYHMTAPHPEGLGGVMAIKSALRQADLTPSDIGYINLHATGTRKNDASEVTGVSSVFNEKTPTSGTKGLTGHTLGAAGAIEAVITILALESNTLPGTTGISSVDESFRLNILTEPLSDNSVNFALSNSFGFGGNNASLIFGRST